MSIVEMCAACAEFRELQRMSEEIAAEMEAIKNRIRAAMGDRSEVIAGEYKISNKTVTGSRLDSKALRAELPEIAVRFTVETVQTRFQIR